SKRRRSPYHHFPKVSLHRRNPKYRLPNMLLRSLPHPFPHPPCEHRAKSWVSPLRHGRQAPWRRSLELLRGSVGSRMRWSVLLLACIWVGLAGSVTAAERDTLEVILPSITIEATRAAETDDSAPFAMSVVERPHARVATESATSLQDVLSAVPGLWVNDRGHFALGERIIIRGA